MKKVIALTILSLAGSILLNSCKKKFDNPPFKEVNDGAKINISTLKQRVPANSMAYRFGMGDTNLYATVIADETSGNLYKQIFVMDDAGGAIQLNLLTSGGLAVGDKIRLNLNNAYVVNANSMVFIDSVDVGKSIVKASSGNVVTPKVVTMGDILAGSVPSNTNSLQSQLVQINNVEFTEKGFPFADAIGKASVNRVIKGCNTTNTLTVRTSGYANFASKLTPNGNGSIIAIVTQYNSTMQLTIRDYNEVQMNNAGCAPPTFTFTLGSPVSTINETFSSQTTTNTAINLNGWINFDETGTRSWFSDVNAGNYRAKATSFGSTNPDPQNKIWLITPPINASSTPTMSFNSAMAFPITTHTNALTVWISTSFNGSNVTSAGTWTAVPATVAPLNGTSYAWVNSGTINLASLLPSGYTGTYFIAFRYYGNKPAGLTTNYYLDDIIIQ